jgi:hypothetical protein
MKRLTLLVLGIFLTGNIALAGTATEDPDIYQLAQTYSLGKNPTPQQMGSARYLICSWQSARRGEFLNDYKQFEVTFKSDHILFEEIREDNNKLPRVGLRYTSAGLLGQVSENFYIALRWVPGDYLMAEAFYAPTTPYEASLPWENYFGRAITYAQGYAHSYMECLPTQR